MATSDVPTRGVSAMSTLARQGQVGDSERPRLGGSLTQRLSPGILSGITLGTWLRVLRENRFDIDRPYWLRAVAVTLGAVPNTALAWAEALLYGCEVRRARIEPPLFVLGLWRSGTTHLHNLLARDPRFACPSTHQVLFPNTFLAAGSLHAAAVGRLMDARRPMDNVRAGAGEPQEDEWAFAALIGRTHMLAEAFPRRADWYDRYLTLRRLGPAELAQWEATMLYLAAKLSYRHRRPLVLKSPAHTGRVRVLLRLFPDARFVLVRRDPYAIFRSALHMARATAEGAAYQRPDGSDPAERILRNYREVADAYFEDRELIPPGRLHELRFEDLQADPVGQLRAAYEALALPEFARAEPAVRNYLAELSDYEKNRHRGLTHDERARVAAEWGRLFDEWDYPC